MSPLLLSLLLLVLLLLLLLPLFVGRPLVCACHSGWRPRARPPGAGGRAPDRQMGAPARPIMARTPQRANLYSIYCAALNLAPIGLGEPGADYCQVARAAAGAAEWLPRPAAPPISRPAVRALIGGARAARTIGKTAAKLAGPIARATATSLKHLETGFFSAETHFQRRPI